VKEKLPVFPKWFGKSFGYRSLPIFYFTSLLLFEAEAEMEA